MADEEIIHDPIFLEDEDIEAGFVNAYNFGRGLAYGFVSKSRRLASRGEVRPIYRIHVKPKIGAAS